MKRLADVEGHTFRLTDERLEHVQRRPEMDGQLPKIEETPGEPDEIGATTGTTPSASTIAGTRRRR